MKKITFLLIGVCIAITALSQSSQTFKYQAVLRDGSGDNLADHNCTIEIALLNGGPTASSIYTETHNITTNDYGLVNLNIGSGTSSDDFSTIDWSKGPYYIRISVDGTLFGTSQLVSVPYALYAESAETITGTISESDPVYSSSVANGITEIDTANWNNKLDSEIQTLADVIANNNEANGQIKNVTDPSDAQDAATKAYVDLLLDKISELEALTIKLEDYDGNHYSTVKIGTQIWMAENLKTTHYANGDSIPNGTGKGDISGETDPKYWFTYNDTINYVFTYGRLYTWHTVTDSRNVCPNGWHVPTDAEWTTLENYLIANGYNYDGTTTDNKIAKSLASTTNWDSSSDAGDVGNTDYPIYRNKTGFTALPGGARNNVGNFLHVGSVGVWWTVTENTSLNAWYLDINADFGDTYWFHTDKKYGLSVRCLRD